MVIEINKDIDRYRNLWQWDLQQNSLYFPLPSVVVGGGIVLLLYKYISVLRVQLMWQSLV